MTQSKTSKTFEIKFTTDKLERIKAPVTEEMHIYRNTAEKGFILRVYRSNKKVFYFRNYKLQNKIIGEFPYITLDEAKAEVFKIKRNLCHGVAIESTLASNNQTITFKEVYNRYWQEHLIYNGTKASQKTIYCIINVHAKHLFERPIFSIISTEIQDLHAKITKRGVYIANRLIETLNPIFNHAIDWGYIDQNPCSKVKKHKEISRSRFLSSEEIKKLFDSIGADENQDAKDFILISLYTGVRKSAVLSMNWTNISFEEKTWSVLIKNKEKIPQILPLVAPIIQILERRKDNNSKWVFPSDLSTMGHLEGIRKPWARILKRAGLDDVRLHDLRRTLASWMAMNGNNGYVIAKVLNHKDSKATDIYARLDNAPVRAAMSDVVGQFENIRNSHTENQPTISKEEEIRQLKERLKLLEEE